MVPLFQKFEMDYIIGKEIGSGTPHLQGFVEHKDLKFRPIEKFKLAKQIHWKKAKGTTPQNIKYCSKEHIEVVYSARCKPPRELKLITPDRPWEIEILDIIKEEPDDRTLYWYWSKEGNMGKTSFCKYLTVKHGAIPLGGKAADVRNGIVTHIKEKGSAPDIIVIPIPRSFDRTYVSYEAMENGKDMYFYSGKYEGGAVCEPCPHLFVFANFEPDREKMSSDRWKVVEIV